MDIAKVVQLSITERNKLRELESSAVTAANQLAEFKALLEKKHGPVYRSRMEILDDMSAEQADGFTSDDPTAGTTHLIFYKNPTGL